ncbi:DUF2141 domain-containing protein [Hyphomonas jannaschiana]|uniref:DUF2141 domain-containing protein n=1 Tax=Hyphomonas jannaschiana VP2 TaxID=1280952 RepID=A0A059FEH0_9PROT|nr:DUF2141 domain-containing protein [Hyphomonas jannaschiana]KCZ88951.1 hypothetical protein HJA_06637 [Hyphomonas jannaschiana VP2]
MKRILNSIIAAALAAGIAGQAAAADLTIRIEGVEEATGTIHVAVFGADGWDENDAVAGRLAPAEEGAELVFTGLEPGAYGIKVYQDVDDNGELNLGMWRIPTEPYGFSNDASASMGPPKFKLARIDLPEAGTVHTITLQ